MELEPVCLKLTSFPTSTAKDCRSMLLVLTSAPIHSHSIYDKQVTGVTGEW